MQFYARFLLHYIIMRIFQVVLNAGFQWLKKMIKQEYLQHFNYFLNPITKVECIDVLIHLNVASDESSTSLTTIVFCFDLEWHCSLEAGWHKFAFAIIVTLCFNFTLRWYAILPKRSYMHTRKETPKVTPKSTYGSISTLILSLEIYQSTCYWSSPITNAMFQSQQTICQFLIHVIIELGKGSSFG